MTSTAVINIGELASGVLAQPTVDADAILARDGRIVAIGHAGELAISGADLIVDCNGTTVIPGLIDSHCHVVIGDYTPRQKTVDFLDSYVHGGITSVVSAGEIHAPGRPHDRIAVKALAVAALKCFERFRPTGMKVNAGSLILEPSLLEEDFAELADYGVRLAKFGFGAYEDPADGEPQVRWAKQHGMVVMAHTGGASIPGSKPISAGHLMKLQPNVCGHANGGTTALSDRDVEMLVRQSGMCLQIVQAGNLRSALRIIAVALEAGALGRVVLASDTPTGTGVMPMGVIKTVCEMASLSGISAAQAIALATGNNAQHFGLDTGTIEIGKPADFVVCDAPLGSVAGSALEAIPVGDIPGISMVIIDGIPRIGRSRNTPAAARLASAVDRAGNSIAFTAGH